MARNVPKIVAKCFKSIKTSFRNLLSKENIWMARKYPDRKYLLVQFRIKPFITLPFEQTTFFIAVIPLKYLLFLCVSYFLIYDFLKCDKSLKVSFIGRFISLEKCVFKPQLKSWNIYVSYFLMDYFLKHKKAKAQLKLQNIFWHLIQTRFIQKT